VDNCAPSFDASQTGPNNSTSPPDSSDHTAVIASHNLMPLLGKTSSGCGFGVDNSQPDSKWGALVTPNVLLLLCFDRDTETEGESVWEMDARSRDDIV